MSAENFQAAHLPHPADPSLDPRDRLNAVRYQNLLLAVAARKADRSPYYAPNLSHGTTTPDLDRSTAAAGEDPEALKAHLCLFDRFLGRLAGLVAWVKAGVAPAASLGPHDASVSGPSLEPARAESSSNSAPSPRQDANPSPGNRADVSSLQPDPPEADPSSETPLVVTAASPRPLKLVRALALLAWRPLRLLHTQAWWECRAVCFLLHELIEWRRQHGPLTPKRLDDFQYEIGQALSDPIWQTERVKTVQRRWELLWQALFDPVGWAQRLARSIGLGSGGRRSPFHPNWMERLEQLPPEALANPGRSPGEIVKALERRQQRAIVKEPKDWKVSAAAGEGNAAGEVTPPAPGKRRPRSKASSLAYDESLTRHCDPRRRQPPDRVLRRLEKRGRIQVPATFEDFQKLVQAALGARPDVDVRPSAGSGQALRGADAGRPGAGGPTGATAGPPNTVDLRVAGHSKAEGSRAIAHSKARRNSPSGAPQGSAAAAGDGDASLRGVAQALWARMQYGRGRADQVASLLAASLAWDTPGMCQLWPKLLKAEYAYDNIFDLQFRHGAEARFVRPASALASGRSESDGTNAAGTKSGATKSAEAEVEERQAEAEEVRQAAQIWFGAVRDALTGGMAGQHKSLVALYELAVDRFGIRYEFLEWRPALSPNQWTERKQRPEWQVRVVTVDGQAWAKLGDGRIVQARSENMKSEV